MKVNYNWLTEWVDIDLKPDGLANLLDRLGIEVEELRITGNDAIFTLEITPNRPDLLSVQGLAREISIKTNKKIKKTIDYPIAKKNRTSKSNNISVEIENNEDCSRYIASIVDCIEVRPSPPIISERLEKCGIRSLNNIIDITNYVLLEVGHPLHAFDYNKINGRKIIVRRAKNGELIITLEGENIELTKQDLVIADNKKPIAIAGVMGGEESGVSEKTKTVVLESAYFNPSLIRNTSKRLKLITESSYRFERKADIGALKLASEYAVYLFGKYSNGKLLDEIIDTNPDPNIHKEVFFSYEKANNLLGMNLKRNEIDKIFTKLGLKKIENGDIVKTIVPSFRRDIEITEDLVEELGRFIGYDKIESKFGYRNSSPVSLEGTEILKIKKFMPSLGFSEAMNIPFIEPSWAKIQDKNPVEINNPLWRDKSILSTTLIPGLISSIKRNLNRGENKVALFEVGRIFTLNGGEKEMLAAAIAGEIPASWYRESHSVDFYDLKGVIETLLEKLNIKKYEFPECRDRLYKKERALSLIINKEKIGSFGLFSQNICKVDIYGFEFSLYKLLEYAKVKTEFSSIHIYPPIKRDLSFVIDERKTYIECKNAIKDSVKNDIQIELIDIYRDRNFGKDKKSLTVRLEFHNPEKTLTDEEIEKDIENVIKNLTKLGAHLRK